MCVCLVAAVLALSFGACIPAFAVADNSVSVAGTSLSLSPTRKLNKAVEPLLFSPADQQNHAEWLQVLPQRCVARLKPDRSSPVGDGPWLLRHYLRSPPLA